MVKTIIINGSPRAPKSNSKLYAEIFQKYYSGETISFNINNCWACGWGHPARRAQNSNACAGKVERCSTSSTVPCARA